MAPRRKCALKPEEKLNVRRLKNEAVRDEYEQIAEPDPIRNNAWSEEEKEFLLQSVEPLLSDEPYAACSAALKSFNWDLVRVTNRSADECRKQLEDMVKNVKKLRTLREVMNALQQERDNKMNPTLSSQQGYNGEQNVQGNATGARFQIKDRSSKIKVTTSKKRGTKNVVSQTETEEDDDEDAHEPVRQPNPKLSRQQGYNGEPNVQGNASDARFQINDRSSKSTVTTSKKRGTKNVVQETETEEEDEEAAHENQNPTLSRPQGYNGEQNVQGNASGARFQINERSKKSTVTTSKKRGSKNVVSQTETEEDDDDEEAHEPESKPNPTLSREPNVQGNASGARFQINERSKKSTVTTSRKRRTKNVVSQTEEDDECHEKEKHPIRRRKKAEVACDKSEIPSDSGTNKANILRKIKSEMVQQSPEIPTWDLTEPALGPRQTQKRASASEQEAHKNVIIDLTDIVRGIRKAPVNQPSRNKDAKSVKDEEHFQIQWTTTRKVKKDTILSKEPEQNKLKRKQPDKCRTNGAKKKPSFFTVASDSDE